MSRVRLAAMLTALAACATACSAVSDGAASSVPGSTGPPDVDAITDPRDRAVTIRTTACGDASHTTGTGVIVDRTTVVTAAHVVVGATDVFVGGSDERAAVVFLDRTRDLALLKVPTVMATPIELADVAAGDEVQVVGGSASGTVDARVERLLVMNVDDVRSTSRSSRSGFELDAAIDSGDSGAGVFADARLVGIVFAVPTERSDATFVVDASEIAAVLDTTVVHEYRCNPSRSQIAQVGD